MERMCITSSRPASRRLRGPWMLPRSMIREWKGLCLPRVFCNRNNDIIIKKGAPPSGERPFYYVIRQDCQIRLLNFLEQLFCFYRLIALGKDLPQFLQYILGALGVIDG